MEQKVSPAKSSIQLGVLFGMTMVLEFVITYIIGVESLVNGPTGLIINLLNFLFFPFLFIVLACNNFKKINNGFISFSQCLKAGVTVMFLGALIYALFSVIFNMIFPEYMDEMVAIIRTKTIHDSPDMPAAQLKMTLDMQRKFMNPAITAPVTVAMYSFFGLIYSLIVGAIVKKEQPQSF